MLAIAFVGTRVVLNRDLDIFNLGRFPKGATGTISWVSSVSSWNMITDPLYDIEFDLKFSDLDGWDNHIQVYDPENGEVTPADFDPI